MDGQRMRAEYKSIEIFPVKLYNIHREQFMKKQKVKVKKSLFSKNGQSVKKSGRHGLSGKKSNRTVMLSVAAVVVVLAIIVGGYISMLGPVDARNGKTKEVFIEEGSYLPQIAHILKENDLIKNEFAFKVYVRLKGKATDLRAGYYSLSQKYPAYQIVKALVKGGSSKSAMITIKEGYDLNRIGKLFEKQGIFTKKEFLEEIKENKKFYKKNYKFLKSVPKDREYILEGYLYADTYDIYQKATPRDAIMKMLDRFDQEWTDEYQKRADELGLTVDQVVTMASLVEREGILDKELPVIASVFYNRIKIDMPLQSCATLQYIYQDYQFSFSESQKNIDSPYNTYKYPGLPAGPISNFRSAALKAALYPADSDYLYFCTKNDGTGANAFAKSYKEHQKNIEKYSKNWE